LHWNLNVKMIEEKINNNIPFNTDIFRLYHNKDKVEIPFEAELHDFVSSVEEVIYGNEELAVGFYSLFESLHKIKQEGIAFIMDNNMKIKSIFEKTKEEFENENIDNTNPELKDLVFKVIEKQNDETLDAFRTKENLQQFRNKTYQDLIQEIRESGYPQEPITNTVNLLESSIMIEICLFAFDIISEDDYANISTSRVEELKNILRSNTNLYNKSFEFINDALHEAIKREEELKTSIHKIFDKYDDVFKALA